VLLSKAEWGVFPSSSTREHAASAMNEYRLSSRKQQVVDANRRRQRERPAPLLTAQTPSGKDEQNRKRYCREFCREWPFVYVCFLVGIMTEFVESAGSYKFPQTNTTGSGRLRIWRVKPWGFESPLSHQQLAPHSQMANFRLCPNLCPPADFPVVPQPRFAPTMRRHSAWPQLEDARTAE